MSKTIPVLQHYKKDTTTLEDNLYSDCVKTNKTIFIKLYNLVRLKFCGIFM